MKLRKLRLSDADLMLEWMHDRSVVKDLHGDFMSKSLADCEKFIRNAQDDSQNLHLAIVDDQDQYMGTVSLKNIRKETAEFAITVRKAAIGKGYSRYGMDEILRMGLEKLGLQTIYWCVDPKNTRAIRFYEKQKYERVAADCLEIQGNYTPDEICSYLWYRVTKSRN